MSKKIINNSKKPSKKRKRKGGTVHKSNNYQKNKKHKKEKNNSFFNLSKIFDFVFFVLVIVLLMGSWLFMISEKEDKTIAGFRFYDVLTDSMVKTKPDQKGGFNSGDMIIIKSVKPEEVKVGDIITFVPNIDSKNTFLTHRVIEIKEAKKDTEKQVPSFVTQGDANNSPDPEINGENVIGKKIIVIPKVGSIIKFIRENIWTSIIFTVSLFAFVFLISNYLKQEKKKIKRTRRKKK